MPVERYSSIDQAPEAAGRVRDPMTALERMLDLVSVTTADCPPLFQPGVYRYRSVAEADEVRETLTLRRARQLRTSRPQEPA